VSKVGAASSVSWGVGCHYFISRPLSVTGVFLRIVFSLPSIPRSALLTFAGMRKPFHTIGIVNVLSTPIKDTPKSMHLSNIDKYMVSRFINANKRHSYVDVDALVQR